MEDDGHGVVGAIVAIIVGVFVMGFILYTKIEKVEDSCTEVKSYVSSTTELYDAIEAYNKKVVNYNREVSAKEKMELKHAP